MASWDRNTIILLDLVKQPENARCADCGAPVIFTSKLDPDWASYKLGVFVCLNCSGTHRDLTDVSRVKSIRLDNWEDDLVEFMRRNGNAVAKAQYEKSVPAFYYRPQQHDCVVLRDQWIRAKYARQEFTGKNGHLQKAYSSGFCDGTLWKKGKNKRQFQKRRFVLSQDDFTLRYFIKEDSKVAKAIISVRNMNAVFQPEKVGHQNGLQITYMTEDRTRNLFVYHENGQEIVNWFNAVRAVRYAYLRKALAPANDSELMPLLTTRSLKEGYMEKTGPMQWEPFKRRWFVLCSVDRKLLYFKTPMDALELGAVFIGTEAHGFSVRETPTRGSRGSRWRYGLTMETPDRNFIFMCEQELEQRDWIKAFQQVIAQPLLPQHYSIEANMKRKKS
ncbi:arf-GAP with dual PH domain-containing protein 1 isoform X2 [Denticeps clupeoides]|uniref:arf-GAP with dual PH domain-containing protein 1 isoform X2 n=1 Tax=Denticeps clupeoides TaxID=299321 RepID=UPI0010A564C6|nr:arf-GAP with dual PH domain-containing protein 2 isoform X2 [Denticeps clupeoides]